MVSLIASLEKTLHLMTTVSLGSCKLGIIKITIKKKKKRPSRGLDLEEEMLVSVHFIVTFQNCYASLVLGNE